MDSYRTEEEQVEALKRWWKENGTNTLVAILLAAAVAFGWQGWQARREARAEGASVSYQALVSALDAGAAGDGTSAEARELAKGLMADYDGTTYARFAALHLARLEVAAGELAAAEALLREVLEETSAGSDLQRIARLRLGRVMAAQGRTEAALELLGAGDGPYAGAFALARGDVLFAAGREAEARAAYREAQALAAPARPLRGLDEKLDYLDPQTPGHGAAGV